MVHAIGLKSACNGSNLLGDAMTMRWAVVTRMLNLQRHQHSPRLMKMRLHLHRAAHLPQRKTTSRFKYGYQPSAIRHQSINHRFSISKDRVDDAIFADC